MSNNEISKCIVKHMKDKKQNESNPNILPPLTENQASEIALTAWQEGIKRLVYIISKGVKNMPLLCGSSECISYKLACMKEEFIEKNFVDKPAWAEWERSQTKRIKDCFYSCVDNISDTGGDSEKKNTKILPPLTEYEVQKIVKQVHDYSYRHNYDRSGIFHFMRMELKYMKERFIESNFAPKKPWDEWKRKATEQVLSYMQNNITIKTD